MSINQAAVQSDVLDARTHNAVLPWGRGCHQSHREVRQGEVGGGDLLVAVLLTRDCSRDSHCESFIYVVFAVCLGHHLT